MPDAPASKPTAATGFDEPSPEVAAQFLRPVRAVPARPSPPAAVDDVPEAAVDATLIDAITRIVTGMLERHVRDSVTAAVRALAPRLVVSLPPDGEDGALRARPRRDAARRG